MMKFSILSYPSRFVKPSLEYRASNNPVVSCLGELVGLCINGNIKFIAQQNLTQFSGPKMGKKVVQIVKDFNTSPLLADIEIFYNFDNFLTSGMKIGV